MRRIIYSFLFSLVFSFDFSSRALFAELRKLQIIEINPNEMNSAFPNFQAKWFTSQIAFDEYFKEHTRNIDVEAPQLPVQWQTQALLAIHWPSRDAVIRMPSFLYSQVKDLNKEDNASSEQSLLLTFQLNTPCFGIITDVSPMMLVAFNYQDLQFANIQIQTEHSQSINCLVEEEESEEEESKPELRSPPRP